MGRGSFGAGGFAKAVAGVAVGGMAASVLYQVRGARRDRRRFAPPGRMVDIGGRRIHLWTAGTGSPTVVVVPGLAESGLNWAGLLPELSAESSVVLYDRAGLGWSDPSPWSGSALRAARDLRRALRKAEIPPPYVVVGHSAGGHVARLFAAERPGQVAAVVLVDSSHPEQFRRLAGSRAELVRLTLREVLTPLGPRRLAFDAGWSGRARGAAEARCVPPELVPVRIAFDLSHRQRRAGLRETAAMVTVTPAQVRRRSAGLGAIPLTVLSSSRDDPLCADPRAIAERRRFYSVWYPLQEDLARLSSDAVHVVAEETGHHVHRYRPDVVVGVVLDHVRRARSGGGTR
ncbi:alpha/beta hydrolase [Nonomuraea pusilla]|uniref:Pimeloyl-ACP methyl ester carboxylesterase n=1 Tax=Nonomuraea pusilla TaxID=46177 RepID=A0A1H7M6Q3_9ACTN|nr:alpha/beta fold hydrolase [Nonomuraea pusilla]SEL06874.1 Pimeloyl-ACP methyl ester carboxylesterase [Nonomuraea pusilla]